MKTISDVVRRGQFWVSRMRKDGFPIARRIRFSYLEKQRALFAFIKRERESGFFTIYLMPAMLEVNDDILDNTIIHEIIHSIEGCWSHGKEFHQWGKKAYIKYKLKYPIETKGNREETQELKKTKAYISKSKTIFVNIESGHVVSSFRTTKKIRMQTKAFISQKDIFVGKWMMIKYEGKFLENPYFSKSVTEKDKRKFNKKFASQNCINYPLLKVEKIKKRPKKKIEQLVLF